MSVRDPRSESLGRAFLDLSPASRLLVVNQAGINLGFYMAMPFLADYLTDGLGLAAATAGLVIGARTLSQQGLFLPSGALVDRVGPWAPIVAGCSLRVIAFGLLGLVAHPAVVVGGVLLVGTAGALFNPAVRKYLALESTERRAETFAVFDACTSFGALVGPLLGAVLLPFGFRGVSLVAAGVFAALTVAQVVALPRRHGRAGSPAPILVGVRAVLTHRRLGAQVVASSAYLALFNQVYLSLPIEAERLTGRPEATASIFAVLSVIGIAFQIRITGWCRRRWSVLRSVAVGLAMIGLSFGPLLATAWFVSTASHSAGWLEIAGRAAPVAAATVLFSVGVAVVSPFIVVALSDVVGDDLIGTAYGWYYLVSALMTVVLTTAAGALLDVGGPRGRALCFAVLIVVGLAGACGVWALDRRPVGAATSSTS